MEFIGTFQTFFVIPTGATTGQRITINVGNDGAIKVYNANGVLVTFIGGPVGALISFDPFSTRTVGMIQGTLQWDDTSNPGHGGTIDWDTGNASIPPFLDIDSGNDNNLYTGTTAILVKSGVIFGTQDNSAHVEILDNFGTNPNSNLWVSGSILKAVKSGIPATTLTTYKWQTPVLGAGWATGSSTAGSAFEPIAYRLDAEDNLVISGTFNATSLTPAATVFTLPANYTPPNSIRYPVSSFSSAGGLVNSSTGIMITNAGAVSVNNAVAILNGQNYCVHGTFPLYNIS